jgi:hypothetical protein
MHWNRIEHGDDKPGISGHILVAARVGNNGSLQYHVTAYYSDQLCIEAMERAGLKVSDNSKGFEVAHNYGLEVLAWAFIDDFLIDS